MTSRNMSIKHVAANLFSKRHAQEKGTIESTIEYGVTYAVITVALGGVPTILSAAFSQLIRSTGESGVASFGMTLGAAMNILLDPLFMFVILPPRHEVMGASIATALSNVVSLGCLQT